MATASVEGEVSTDGDTAEDTGEDTADDTADETAADDTCADTAEDASGPVVDPVAGAFGAPDVLLEVHDTRMSSAATPADVAPMCITPS